MKKSLFLIMFLMISIGALNVRFNNYQAINEKIVYEDDLSFHDLSLSESKNTEIKDRTVFVQLHLDYNKKTKSIDLDEDATVEEIKEARKSRREELKTYYYNKNKNQASSLNFKNSRYMYISKYGPYIEYDYTYEDYLLLEDNIVDMIVSNGNIEKAVIGFSDQKVEDEIAGALYESDAYDYYYDRNFTGRDVTIGILESGIMDTSHSNFTNTDCMTYDNPYWIDTVTEHATTTASIIGGSGGCAPDAKLLSAAGHATYVNAIEWMLDNDVNIINMSFGESLTFGTRSSRSEYIDYIIQQYDVCVVAASGNIGDTTNYKVANPGMAYNAITVGSVGDYCYNSSFTKYVVTDGVPKPTVAAVGEGIEAQGIDEVNSGTSFSTALVTGMVAIFMDNYYVLTIQIPRIMSLLCNGAYIEYPTLYPRSLSNKFNDELGAGIVSLETSITISRYGRNLVNNGAPASGVIFNYDFTLTPNQNYRFALAWFYGEKGVQGSEAHTPYKLAITDRSGNPLYLSQDVNSNVLMIDFTPTYTLDVSLVVMQVPGTTLVDGTEEVYLSSNFYF